MSTPTRLSRLIDSALASDRQRLWWTAMVINCPPDLSFAADGAQRILDRIDKIVVPLEARFEQVRRGRSERFRAQVRVDELRNGTRLLRALALGIAASPEDPIRWEMVGVAGRKHCPLHGSFLEDCPFWATLFYEMPADCEVAAIKAYAQITNVVTVEVFSALAGQSSARYKRRIAALTHELETEATERGSPLAGLVWNRVGQGCLTLRQLSSKETIPWLLDMAGSVEGEPLKAIMRRVSDLWRPDLLARELEDKALAWAKGDTADRKARSRKLFVYNRLELLSRASEDDRAASQRDSSGSHGRNSAETVNATIYGSLRIGADVEAFETHTSENGLLVQKLVVAHQLKSPQDENGEVLDAFDLSPANDPAQSQCFLNVADLESEPAADRRPASLQRHAHGYARRDRARLRARTTVLGPHDVEILAKRLPESTFPDTARTTITWLRFVLCTGRRPSSCSVRVVRGQSSAEIAAREPASPALGKLIYCIDERVLMVPIPPPTQIKALSACERETGKYLILPDLPGLGCAFLAESNDEACARLEISPGIEVDRAVEKLVRKWLSRPDVGMGHLEAFVADRFIDACNQDVVPATILIGRDILHGPTASHYSALGGERLELAYRKAMAPLYSIIQPIPKQLKSSLLARRVPLASSIVELIEEMRARCDDSDRVIAVQWLVAYSMLGFHLATAARPQIRRKLPHDLISLVTMTEKAVTPYHWRLMPLHCIVHDQLGYMASAVRDFAPDWDGLTDGLFMKISRKGLAGPFGPRAFRELAKLCGFDLELYAIRRFVRTELAESGVSGEDIDALMGHWHDFASPFDPFSTYPPRRLLKVVEGPISDLLKKVGYTTRRLLPCRSR